MVRPRIETNSCLTQPSRCLPTPSCDDTNVSTLQNVVFFSEIEIIGFVQKPNDPNQGVFNNSSMTGISRRVKKILQVC